MHTSTPNMKKGERSRSAQHSRQKTVVPSRSRSFEPRSRSPAHVEKQQSYHRPQECVGGPNIYGTLLGPTVDEQILAGLQALFNMCGECRQRETEESPPEDPEPIPEEPEPPESFYSEPSFQSKEETIYSEPSNEVGSVLEESNTVRGESSHEVEAAPPEPSIKGSFVEAVTSPSAATKESTVKSAVESVPESAESTVTVTVLSDETQTVEESKSELISEESQTSSENSCQCKPSTHDCECGTLRICFPPDDICGPTNQSGSEESEEVEIVSINPSHHEPSQHGSHHEASHQGSSHHEPSHHGSSHHEPSKHGSSHHEPSHHGSSHHEPSHHGSSHHEPSKHGSSHHEPSKHGSSHHEHSHKGSHHEPSHHGSSPHGSSHHDPSHHGSSHHEPSHHGSTHPSHHGSTHSSHHSLSHHGSTHGSIKHEPAAHGSHHSALKLPADHHDTKSHLPHQHKLEVETKTCSCCQCKNCEAKTGTSSSSSGSAKKVTLSVDNLSQSSQESEAPENDKNKHDSTCNCCYCKNCRSMQPKSDTCTSTAASRKPSKSEIESDTKESSTSYTCISSTKQDVAKDSSCQPDIVISPKEAASTSTSSLDLCKPKSSIRKNECCSKCQRNKPPKKVSLCECDTSDNVNKAESGDGSQSAVRYAITKITKFANYTTYEVLKSTGKKPKVMPTKVEGVFVLKNRKF